MRWIQGFIIITLITLSLYTAGCTSQVNQEKWQQAGWITLGTTIAPPAPVHQVSKPGTIPGTNDTTIMPLLLSRIGVQVNLSLETLDRNISGAARTLGYSGISGNVANNALEHLAASPAVIDAVTVANDGTIAAVMPARYQAVIGDNVSDQSHILKVLSTGNPALSDEFKTLEGFNASAVVHPVRSANGTVIGLLSVPFLPESLLSGAIVPLLDNRIYEVTVIQMDGRIIYATNTSQVGMNSRLDPPFISRPDMTSFINQVLSADSGRGTYLVHDTTTKTTGTVENYWTTVGLHGTRWRVILDTIRV